MSSSREPFSSPLWKFSSEHIVRWMRLVPLIHFICPPPGNHGGTFSTTKSALVNYAVHYKGETRTCQRDIQQ